MNAFVPIPPQASTLAPAHDVLFYAMVGLTGFVAIVVSFLVIYFAIRYRAGSKADRSLPSKAAQEHRNWKIELSWTLTPLLIFIGIFVWAAKIYFTGQNAPAGALQVFVVAKQWMWKLEHTNGAREINELHVPRNYPVRLVMTSQDVIHSFFVPAFRLKHDVLPGRYVTLWFKATESGEFHLFCAEYCGTDHSHMGGKIIVMEPADYERWLNTNATQSMAQRGEAHFRAFGCSGCHGANASVRAPRLEGIFGKPVPLQDGSTVVADERYIRDSILLPRKEVAAGYEPIMPSFAGQIGEEELLELTAYIESLAERRDKP
jgi:cytochrome c oxidase subunit 2